jgi:hypothetical protein
MEAKVLGRIVIVAAVQTLMAGCGGGGGSSSTSDNSSAATVAAPVISAQPANASVVTGDTATFSVSATGTGLSYQWQRNGTPIAGATASTYTAPAAAYGDSGATYSVVVSNAGGSVTSANAQLNLALSADQQVFESLAVAPNAGSYSFEWNLNYSGAQASGTDYATDSYGLLQQSPLTHGPQRQVQSTPENLSSTLAVPSFGPDRVLKNGAILVVPGTGYTAVVSYVGSDVQVDTLASDNTTVAYSQRRNGYSQAALSGAIGGTPADFAHWYNSFFSNTAVLNANAAYASGASYIKYTAFNLGDRYRVFDCTTATTDANVTPCASGTTLDAALTTGIHSNSDGTTYHLADGAIGTISGVPVWVAATARPQSATMSTTVEYRVYFQLNGNVYTGALIKDGAQLGGSYYVSNPSGATVTDRVTFLDFQIRMNKAARDSIAAAMQI